MTAFRNQVAVVTGASGGIGSAISEALARREAALLITGRDGVKLAAEAERLRAFTASVEWFACDLTKDDAVEQLCDLVSEKYDRLDVLVHCAGVIDHGKLADAPLTSLDRQYRANVRGPLLLTQRLLPLLKRPKGQIVFVNSSTGLNARANAGHFSATQHALKAAADALREEENPDGLLECVSGAHRYPSYLGPACAPRPSVRAGAAPAAGRCCQRRPQCPLTALDR